MSAARDQLGTSASLLRPAAPTKCPRTPLLAENGAHGDASAGFDHHAQDAPVPGKQRRRRAVFARAAVALALVAAAATLGALVTKRGRGDATATAQVGAKDAPPLPLPKPRTHPTATCRAAVAMLLSAPATRPDSAPPVCDCTAACLASSAPLPCCVDYARVADWLAQLLAATDRIPPELRFPEHLGGNFWSVWGVAQWAPAAWGSVSLGPNSPRIPEHADQGDGQGVPAVNATWGAALAVPRKCTWWLPPTEPEADAGWKVECADQADVVHVQWAPDDESPLSAKRADVARLASSDTKPIVYSAMQLATAAALADVALPAAVAVGIGTTHPRSRADAPALPTDLYYATLRGADTLEALKAAAARLDYCGFAFKVSESGERQGAKLPVDPTPGRDWRVEDASYALTRGGASPVAADAAPLQLDSEGGYEHVAAQANAFTGGRIVPWSDCAVRRVLLRGEMGGAAWADVYDAHRGNRTGVRAGRWFEAAQA